jgi:hypothetical protein
MTAFSRPYLDNACPRFHPFSSHSLRHTASAVRIIEQRLKPFSELGRKPGRPTSIDQPKLDHVSQMGSVFVPITVEFHLDQGFEFHDSFLIDFDRSINTRCWTDILRPNFAACEEYVQTLARLSIRAVQKNNGPHHFIPNEPSVLQRIGRTGQILFGEKQVDIPGVADGTIVDRCHPRRHSVATDDGIRNLGVAERLAGSIQSFLDEFHGAKHPFENIKSALANHAG